MISIICEGVPTHSIQKWKREERTGGEKKEKKRKEEEEKAKKEKEKERADSKGYRKVLSPL